jgi:WW domain-containing oxidoreductase
VSGEYFRDSNLCKPSEKARDAEQAKKLWDFSVKLVTLSMMLCSRR